MKRKHARGFTFIELLVATFISGLVLASVYFVFISNARQFYTQEQVVQMQEGMRFAVEILKTDLRNAGRLAVVNGAAGANMDPGFCAPGTVPNAVELFNNENTAPAILRANNNGLRPDRVRLLVDASAGIPLSSMSLGGTQLSIAPAALQETSDGRDALSSQARFEAMYKTGYFARIESMDGAGFDVIPIVAANYNGGAPVINLTRAACFQASACDGRCMVNPVTLVEYRLAPDPPEDAAATKTDLVRRVLDSRNPDNVLPGLSLTIGEYVIDLQVWGTYDIRADGAPLPDIPADATPLDDVGNWPVGGDEASIMNLRPERIRSFNLSLATRTSREDADFHIAVDRARAPNQRVALDRTWFDVVADNADQDPQFARVTTLRTEVESPNLLRSF